MSKQVMTRRASDNKYLHRDFHVSADIGLEYVGRQYGDKGVEEYLTVFTVEYYKPLIENCKKIGIKAIEEWLRETYKKEEAEEAIEIISNENEISVKVKYCPAIEFMKKSGHVPSKWFKQTTILVNRVIAEQSGLIFEMGQYDELTGKADFIFKRFIGEKR